MVKDFLDRIVAELVRDKELHLALIMLIKAKTAHEEALARRANIQVVDRHSGR